MPFLPLRALTAPLFALSASASAVPDAAAAPSPRAADTLAPGNYRWLSEGPWTGPIYLIVSIDRQMVHVYDGDRLIGMASVSTGMKGHSTPKGEFSILQKRQWHRSNLYSNAPMPFMQRLTWDGIALHAGQNPGYPASHGCIRMPYAFAQKLFGITKMGNMVEITADRLAPMLKRDPLLLDDPGVAVMTFTPRRASAPASERALPPDGTENGIPYLEIDPGIFGPRGPAR